MSNLIYKKYQINKLINSKFGHSGITNKNTPHQEIIKKANSGYFA